MRVALVSFNAKRRDAIGNQVARKLAFFLERGADVRVFVEDDDQAHPDLRGYLRRLSPTNADHESLTFLSQADLVLVEFGHAYDLLNLLPLLAGKKPRIVLDYHGVTPPELWDGHNRQALEQGGRRRGIVWCADAALVHSQFTGRELRGPTGFERIIEIGHPVDTTLFSPDMPNPSLHERLRLGQGSILLFVGRVAPNKRVQVLVEALARLRARTPPVHAVIIGDTADIYDNEAKRCRELAAGLGVADRVHFLGQVDEEQLRDAYRSASVFVMPSRHEGFGIPVIEAMACGLPVVAARAGALPETVADAGLTFCPDDPEDLARQVERVLDMKHSTVPRAAKRPRRGIAVVSFRYGSDFAGGAETSLRTIAREMHRAGHGVEVFSTCTRGESDWRNELREGTTDDAGIAVYRFRIDHTDRDRHLEAVRAILTATGPVADVVEAEYLRHTVRSTALVEALARRIGEFDAVIVGPYLFGLTWDVARRFPDKTLLLPCFHDEPMARLRAWLHVYGHVGGILYHSPEEQDFAQTILGLNHPNAVEIGTLVKVDDSTSEDGNQAAPGLYLVYCGRYSEQKELPRLIDYARRYHERNPGRFRFVFLGQGHVTIPREPWAQHLGFVREERKQAILKNAAALVQLSRQESLSLVALEAWACGTPVIADAAGAVLAGQLRRSGGGRVVEDFEAFARALDELWDKPDLWRAMGQKGHDYVRSHYASATGFTGRLEGAMGGLQTRLQEQLRHRGLRRAAGFALSAWRERFAEIIEAVLDADPRPYREQVEVTPNQPTLRGVSSGKTILVSVHVTNRGTHPHVPDGPARTVLCSQVDNSPTVEVALPDLLAPGQTLAAVVPVNLPERPGSYQVTFWAERRTLETEWPGLSLPDPSHGIRNSAPATQTSTVVLSLGAGDEEVNGACAPLLQRANAALTEAHQLQQLPDTYADITQGWLARMKGWLKRKLLNNFKRAYVDVLSRQQTRVNQQLVRSVQELSDCCATLDHAVRLLQERVDRLENAAGGVAMPRATPQAAQGKPQAAEGVSSNSQFDSAAPG
jgi:glycosyltransferase involved in cell wall biosynthesis